MLKKYKKTAVFIIQLLASAVVGVGILLLTGCAPETIKPYNCPPIIEYSKELQTKAADDLEWLPSDAVLPRFLDDYLDLRDMLRETGCE